jgi:hypothetical protein
MGGDENWVFSDRYIEKFTYTSIIIDEFVRYLGLSDDEFSNLIIGKWGNMNYWFDIVPTSGLMEAPFILWYIIEFDIPDEVIIEGIRIHNEHFGSRRWQEYRVFTDEDIQALLSRDETIITAQFATEYAIVIEGRAFSPAWVYLHTPEDYEAVGITPEMIEEKLHLYAEFSFTEEATLAFEAKLSGFLGRDVVLAEERAMSTADALLVLRAVAGLAELTDAQIARYGISGEPAAADAVRILRIVAGL